MSIDQWHILIVSENFWSGVLASIFAAAIVAFFVFVFRNSLSRIQARQERGRREDEVFEAALQSSRPIAPFAFGVVQGRALRYFLTAVFIAYIGDILSFAFPATIILYMFSLYYTYLALKWFYKIEKRALDIITKLDL